MGRVVLRPRVRFGAAVDEATLAELHHKSHENCFIANSVTTNVTVEPQT
jgi:organic hydroperoxide reductase OsmC/OhrA